MTPWTSAHQAPPSMGFSRQECWSGVHMYCSSGEKTQLALKITLILYQSNIGFYKLLQIYQHAQRIQFYILQSSLTRKLTSSSVNRGFPDSSVGKEFTCNAGDPVSTPRLGRSTGEGIGYPLQYPWASLVAQLVKKICWQCGRLGFNPWVGKIPWRRKRLPTQAF